jgi:hypothetical protein
MKGFASRITLAAFGLLVLGVGTAGAADHRIPAGGGPFDIPAEDCGFPIHVVDVQNKEYIVRTIDNPDGSTTLRITGKLVLSFTNTGTGKTIEWNASGPGWFTFSDDGLVADVQGRTAGYYGPAEQAATGMPGLLLVSGHQRVVLDEEGLATSVVNVGHVQDGCALLAGP